MSYKFESTVELQGLKEIFALSGTEWSKPLTPDEFALLEAKKVVDRILAGRPARGFCLRSREDNKIAATCIVAQNKALAKEPSLSSIGVTPDPTLFGVKNATALLVSYVFVAKDHRKKGLMQEVVSKAIKYTEEEILQRELAKSSDAKDSFRLMVQNGKEIDHSMANHYLGKKYLWYLYSAIGPAYSRLGFKAFPLEGYEIGFSFSDRESSKNVAALLAGGTDGKRLELLDGSKQKDVDLIQQILHGKELELLTEMNKNLFHLELSGGRRSSLSLTNLLQALRSSHGDLGALKEEPRNSGAIESAKQGAKGNAEDESASLSSQFSTLGVSGNLVFETRRKSSVLQFSGPKFAIVPTRDIIEAAFVSTKEVAKRYGTAENPGVADIRGAVVTNEMQQKSFYVLWKTLKQKEFHIIGMGEMKPDPFSGIGRRSSSFTGMNEMGGYNFQDLELLLAAAVHIAKQETINGTPSIHVALNDLPATIPAPVLHDFFMNFLTRDLPGVVSFVQDYTLLGTLPMLRRFGSTDANFELDWVSNSLALWG